MFEVRKAQCHGDHFVVDVRQLFDDYESAKALYDALVEEERAKTPQYNYKRSERFCCLDTQDENTIFTDNDNFHIDRNENNFCDIILSVVDY